MYEAVQMKPGIVAIILQFSFSEDYIPRRIKRIDLDRSPYALVKRWPFVVLKFGLVRHVCVLLRRSMSVTASCGNLFIET